MFRDILYNALNKLEALARPITLSIAGPLGIGLYKQETLETTYSATCSALGSTKVSIAGGLYSFFYYKQETCDRLRHTFWK